ncbi:MAG: DedA family protein [Patescibacteria group bacterium]
MHLDLSYVLSLLLTYKYWVLFPIAVFEGPIVTIAAGLFSSRGYFSWPTAYVVIVVADTLGDLLHYYIGYLIRHKRAKGLLNVIRIDEARIRKIEGQFEKHPKKSVLMGKFLHGVGGLIQVAAGVARMDIPTFLLYSIMGTIPKALALVAVGFVYGSYIYQINNFLSAGAFLLLVVTLFGVACYLAASKYLEKEAA